MPEFQPNLWAPWRMDYLRSLGQSEPGGCFLCGYRDSPADDAANLVLWRGARTLLVLNRYPYSNGHVLVAPTRHVGDFADLTDDELGELGRMLRDAQRVLRAALGPEGFNVGANVGRCAGAGLPDHVHFHVVPRWNGDTNFMPVLGGVRVIPQTLEEVRERFLTEAQRLGLPTS